MSTLTRNYGLEKPAQEEQKADSKQSDGEEETPIEDLEIEQDDVKNELMKEFATFTVNNPNGTLKDFYAYLANKIKEEESND